MKKLLFVLVSILSLNVFGSGKVSVQPVYDLESKEIGMVYGFSVYENLLWKFNYSSWTGYGDVDSLNKDDWFTTKHGIDFNFWKIGINPGVQIDYNIEDSHWSEAAYLRLSYQLW